LFFAFSLDSEQAVYLGTMGSHIDTVLAVYSGDCEGTELRCEDDACNVAASQFVDILPAGDYMVAVKAKHAGEQGRVRLKLQHADAHGAMVLDEPGVYVGDTSGGDDTVQSCSYSYPWPPDGDAGVEYDGGTPPSGEECVHIAEAAAGSIASHACLHCACDVDPAGVAACDGTCWSLIGCVRDFCDGNGSDLNCIVDACAPYLDGASAASAVGNALQACPDTCPASGGGMGGGSGTVGGGSAGAAGMTGVGGGLAGFGGGMGGFGGGGSGDALARDDVYVLASCQQELIVSTCGTAMFDSVIEVRTGGLDEGTIQSCSESYNSCTADPRGAAVNTYLSSAGLTFVIVDGASEAEAGQYQMSIIY
jgi:hypothetical protein